MGKASSEALIARGSDELKTKCRATPYGAQHNSDKSGANDSREEASQRGSQPIEGAGVRKLLRLRAVREQQISEPLLDRTTHPNRGHSPRFAASRPRATVVSVPPLAPPGVLRAAA